ncbi:MAG: hypothetical protein QM719_10365 [Thermomonas sp.]
MPVWPGFCVSPRGWPGRAGFRVPASKVASARACTGIIIRLRPVAGQPNFGSSQADHPDPCNRGKQMRTLLGVSIAAVVLASAFSPANAGTETRFQNAQGGVVCQLSIPTLDTMVRAKATGFRNEGTSGAFAICGMESSNSREGVGTVRRISVGLYSLNQSAKTASCTAVNGFANGAPIYSSKNASVAANGATTTLTFDASDFGGTAGDPLPESDFWSITCNLPGNTAIGNMVAEFTVSTPN